MARGNGSAKRAKPGERRFTYVTDAERGDRLATACVDSNVTVAVVLDWLVDRDLDEFVKAHPRDPKKLRPGRRLRLVP